MDKEGSVEVFVNIVVLEKVKLDDLIVFVLDFIFFNLVVLFQFDVGIIIFKNDLFMLEDFVILVLLD